MIDDLLAPPLAADRQGRPQWIATHCVAGQRRNLADQIDPLHLPVPELLAQLNVLPPALERFQQRCGGHPDPTRARHELLERVASYRPGLPAPAIVVWNPASGVLPGRRR